MNARTPVPEGFRDTEPRASEKQVRFIRSLLDERDVTPKDGQSLDDLKAKAETITKKQASAWIEKLLALPKREGARQPRDGGSGWPEVPAGRYALEAPDDKLNPVKFYQVDRPVQGRWEGFTFLSVYASDETYPIKDPDTKRRILSDIAEDPEGATARFGHETNHCGVCGRRLTREDSRERGIGPVCAGNRGWDA